MPAHWSIEDGQTIPLADNPAVSALAFSTGMDAHNVQLTVQCEDGSSYALTFNRNGVPQGPAVKTEAPMAASVTSSKASASASSHDEPTKKK